MDFSFVESDEQVSRGLSVFRNIGEANGDHKTNGYDKSEEWSAESLEIRDLLSAMSKVDKKRISMDTTIFALGLDSINAIQIAGRFRKVGYEISAADILEVSFLML